MRVVVIGAGVVGAAVAAGLTRRGARVTVLEERFPGAGTTATSFGWVGAGSVHAADSDVYFTLTHAAVHAHHALGSDAFRPTGHLEWAGGRVAQEELNRRVDWLTGREWTWPGRLGFHPKQIGESAGWPSACGVPAADGVSTSGRGPCSSGRHADQGASSRYGRTDTRPGRSASARRSAASQPVAVRAPSPPGGPPAGRKSALGPPAGPRRARVGAPARLPVHLRKRPRTPGRRRAPLRPQARRPAGAQRPSRGLPPVRSYGSDGPIARPRAAPGGPAR